MILFYRFFITCFTFFSSIDIWAESLSIDNREKSIQILQEQIQENAESIISNQSKYEETIKELEISRIKLEKAEDSHKSAVADQKKSPSAANERSLWLAENLKKLAERKVRSRKEVAQSLFDKITQLNEKNSLTMDAITLYQSEIDDLKNRNKSQNKESISDRLVKKNGQQEIVEQKKLVAEKE